ncbi:MAG: hypothetical protein AAFR87_25050 [Bacteroidota bacterium]
MIYLLALILLLLGAAYGIRESVSPILLPTMEPAYSFQASRLSDSPIIYSKLHSRLLAEEKEIGYPNINGPSLIRVPDWLPHPLGKYYLYFAHHKGPYIRLAYADSLSGPWKVYDSEIMPLFKSGLATKTSSESSGISDLIKYTHLTEGLALYQIGADARKAWKERQEENIRSSAPTTPHIASPEVIVDHEHKKIRLYYHGVIEGSLQMTKVAESEDGLDFEAKPGILGLPYMRIFSYRGAYYGMAMPGILYRSKDGLKDFEVRHRWLFSTEVRHIGLHLEGEDLYIFFSKVGDSPERILYTRMNLHSEDWNDWAAEPPRELIRPERVWEGASLSKKASLRGAMGEAVNQLRDPDIFQDTDDKLYLLYTGAGEQAIGIASLDKFQDP